MKKLQKGGKIVVYKGYELLKVIALGELKAITKFYDVKTGREYVLTEDGKAYENRQYYGDEGFTQLQEDYTIKELAQAEFKLVEDSVKIGNIEKIYISGPLIGTDKIHWSGRKLDIVLANKINELVQAVNQLSKKTEE